MQRREEPVILPIPPESSLRSVITAQTWDGAPIASETSCQSDFDALAQAHLSAQQRNLESMLFQFAKLCEHHGFEASLQALKSNTVLEQRSFESVFKAGAKSDDGRAAISQLQSYDLSPVEEDPKPRLSERTTTTGYSTFSEYIGSITDLPERVRSDASFKNLPFFDEHGNIKEELPAYIRIMKSLLGQRFVVISNRVNATLQGWEPMGDNCFATMVRSNYFHYMAASVIMLNFLFIIIQTDWVASNAGKDQPKSFVIIGYVFVAYYALELVAQLVVQGKQFFHGYDAGWNLFDFIIVSLGLFDILITLSGQEFVNTSFLKLIRFLRISRVLRMFSAMRIVKDIRLMVDSLSGSLMIFLCCLVMFMILLALFSIFFVQGLASYLDNVTTQNATSLSGFDKVHHLKRYFGSVADCMFTLFTAATGGSDWKSYYSLLRPLGWKYEALFVFFIAFYAFAFFNVVIGVFCEKALCLGAPTDQELMANKYAKDFADARELYGLLKLVLNEDEDQENLDMRMLDAARFKFFISHPAVEQYFEIRGLKLHSAHRFFHMLCELHGSDHIDFVTFVSACIKLDGFASSIDLHVMSVRQLHGLFHLQKSQHEQHKETKKMQRIVEDKFRAYGAAQEHLSKRIDQLSGVVEAAPPVEPTAKNLTSYIPPTAMLPITPTVKDQLPEERVLSGHQDTNHMKVVQSQLSAIDGSVKDLLSTLRQSTAARSDALEQKHHESIVPRNSISDLQLQFNVLQERIMSTVEKSQLSLERSAASQIYREDSRNALEDLRSTQKRTDMAIENNRAQLEMYAAESNRREAELKSFIQTQSDKMEQLYLHVFAQREPFKLPDSNTDWSACLGRRSPRGGEHFSQDRANSFSSRHMTQ